MTADPTSIDDALAAERAARRDAEAHAARLARLQAATAALSGARTPDAVAEVALSAGLATLGGASGVLLVRGAGEALEVLRCAGISERELRARMAGLPRTPARDAWTGAAVFLADPGALAARYPAFAAIAPALGCEALAALPLGSEGRVLGMLVLGFSAPHPFPDAERALASAFAGVCAQALDRARLYVAERMARAEAVAAQRRLAFLDGLSGVLTGTLDERHIRDAVVARAVPALADWAGVLAAAPGEPLRLVAEAGPGTLGERARALIAARADAPALAGPPGAAPTPPRILEPEPEPEGGGDPPLSVAVVQLAARGEPLGVLALASGDGAQRYGAADLALLADVGQRTALALAHARLYGAADAAAREREDFLHVASHELRGPLATLRLTAELLGREVAGGEAGRAGARVEVLLRQAERLARLSSALLDVSRLTAGKLALSPRTLDLAVAVREVVAHHAEGAAAEGTALTADAPHPVPCRADPDRLEQVMGNLVQNALRYGRGTWVRISARAAGDVVQLAVADGGAGIAPEAQARIFGRFERADPGRKDGGRGLGLWIVRSLVEAHGGRVAVESAPGRGATFTVTLPSEPSR
jgi:signal transduction histidine kinase